MAETTDALARTELANKAHTSYKHVPADIADVCRELRARRTFCEVFEKPAISGPMELAQIKDAYRQMQAELEGVK